MPELVKPDDAEAYAKSGGVACGGNDAQADTGKGEQFIERRAGALASFGRGVERYDAMVGNEAGVGSPRTAGTSRGGGGLGGGGGKTGRGVSRCAAALAESGNGPGGSWAEEGLSRATACGAGVQAALCGDGRG